MSDTPVSGERLADVLVQLHGALTVMGAQAGLKEPLNDELLQAAARLRELQAARRELASRVEGYRWVPVEPTELMWQCGQLSGTYTDSNGVPMCISGRSACAVYRAMLAAAPVEVEKP